ncbi:MAG: InlB B-repeat-containing protein [Bacteroidales bacterium]|nr:InlB B-repeat-containing protein [Bacteroidales bacterium]
MKKFYLMIFTIVTLAGLLAISGCKKKETYTVTFNANGGSGIMEAQTFTEGEAQALTHNAFTYDGYTFTGWNTVQGGNGASYTDGQTITATSDMILYAQWENNTRGQLNGHEWVDLGLPSGTKWATCNVGATTPEGYGNYYAWGETESKDTYSWGNYKYSAEGASYQDAKLTKYCNVAQHGNNGFTDALTTLESIDDAATVNWGVGWRMPTGEEMNELLNNCTHECITQNSVYGVKFTGSNGNSIFLPAAGNRYDSEFYDASFGGSFWSSSLYSGNSGRAWFLTFYSGYCGMDYYYRNSGMTVRPVCQSQN